MVMLFTQKWTLRDDAKFRLEPDLFCSKTRAMAWMHCTFQWHQKTKLHSWNYNRTCICLLLSALLGALACIVRHHLYTLHLCQISIASTSLSSTSRPGYPQRPDVVRRHQLRFFVKNACVKTASSLFNFGLRGILLSYRSIHGIFAEFSRLFTKSSPILPL